jgi:hypothetical protein
MPMGKQITAESRSSEEGSSIQDSSDVPTLEIDDGMGNIQSDFLKSGEDIQEEEYGNFEGGGAAARTVYHQPLTDHDTL